MLIKTKGIIFKSIKYGETSLILDIYTEEKGLKKYIISGVRNRKSKVKTGLLQTAFLVDLVAYDRQQKNLNRLKEIKAAENYQSIPFDFIRGTISLFLVELAQKTIKEEETNPELFNFLYQQLLALDQATTLDPNFHLYYMLHLSSFLGFFPGDNWSETTPWFDLKAGLFVASEPLHQYTLNKNLSKKLSELIKGKQTKLTREERQKMLLKLIDYYRVHIENFYGLNTHSILKEVFE
jgi:DNA repair protein RecO (recombination protein O)